MGLIPKKTLDRHNNQIKNSNDVNGERSTLLVNEQVESHKKCKNKDEPLILIS